MLIIYVGVLLITCCFVAFCCGVAVCCSIVRMCAFSIIDVILVVIVLRVMFVVLCVVMLCLLWLDSRCCVLRRADFIVFPCIGLCCFSVCASMC